MASARAYYPEGVPAQVEDPTNTVDSLLAEAAKEYPKHVAIDFLGRTYSYSELAELTRKAAAALYRCGVRKGDTVALIMPNCPQHIIAFYAVLSLGATVAEHNPLAPTNELHEQLDRHGATVVIAWEQTVEKLTEDGDFRGRTYLAMDLSAGLPLSSRMLLKLPVPAARKQRAALRGTVPEGVLSFDRIVRKAPPLPADTTIASPELDDIAVLIHTGGTTGTPKAVMLTHRNLMSNIMQVAAWVPPLQEGKETFAGILPFFHAFGLNTVLGVGILKRSTIVLLPKFDVPALLAAHRRHPITVFPGVAPMYKRVLDGAVAERAEGKEADLSSIAYAFSGAMPLAADLAERWEKETNGLMIEGYGMSEAAPLVAGNPTSADRRPGTLGIPFPSTEIRVADPEDLDKDAEDIGEILVRGPQVFAGYLGEPEETANVMHDGWLRTGDLARWDNGWLVMADRAKEMIINGGFNVYPSQVEEAIKGMPGVRDVAVVGMPADERGESVVAALVLEPGASVDLAAVRRWTADKLSHYAMPKSIAVLEDLPRSQIGKVQRRSVREQLADFELVSGEWKRKATEITEAATDRWEAFTASLADYTNATRDQMREWMDASEHSAEEIKAWFADKGVTTEELKEKLAGAGLSREDLAAWISRSSEAIKAAGDDLRERMDHHGAEAEADDAADDAAEASGDAEASAEDAHALADDAGDASEGEYPRS